VGSMDYYRRLGLSADRWQGRVVLRLLRFFGLEEEARWLRRLAGARTGQAWLRFGTFFEAYPTFPVWLHSGKVPGLHRLTTADWLDPGIPHSLDEAYLDAEEAAQAAQVAEEQPVGLVFEWLHSRLGPAVILHDHDRPPNPQAEGLSWSINGKVYRMERFESFLAGLQWQP
jgi:hypothetical protein